MPEWFRGLTLADVWPALVLLGLAAGLIRKGWPTARAIVHLTELLVGAPETLTAPGRPGLIQYLDTMTGRLDALTGRIDRVETIAAEGAHSAGLAAFHSQPNHGSSAHDQIMRRLDTIEATVAESRKS